MKSNVPPDATDPFGLESEKDLQELRERKQRQQVIDKYLLSLEITITDFKKKSIRPDSGVYGDYLKTLYACKNALEEPEDEEKKCLVSQEMQAHQKKQQVSSTSRFFGKLIGDDYTQVENALTLTIYWLKIPQEMTNKAFESVVPARGRN